MHVGHHVSSFVSSGVYTLEQKMSHNTTFDFNMINVYARTYINTYRYIVYAGVCGLEFNAERQAQGQFISVTLVQVLKLQNG